MSATPWPGNGRTREIQAVEAESRHLWLAGQIDEVDARVIQELASIRHTLNRILVAVVSLLITILASSLTAIISSAGK